MRFLRRGAEGPLRLKDTNDSSSREVWRMEMKLLMACCCNCWFSIDGGCPVCDFDLSMLFEADSAAFSFGLVDIPMAVVDIGDE